MIYNFPESIHFGWGEAENIGRLAKGLGFTTALIVTDEGVERVGLLDGVKTSLKREGISFETFNGVQPNPTDLNVEEGVKAYRETNCDAVIAVGGGSPMDAAKGIVLMTRHPGSLREYYSGEDPRRPVTSDVPPFIAVPTTSGTGSEASRGGIITDTSENRKRVIGSRHLLPKTVILDPQLTVSMPPRLTAYTGLDALSHSIEAFVVDRYAPLADAFAREGMRLVADSLVKAYDAGEDRRAREDMMLASTMGAMAFHKGLGVVHSLAHQLSPQVGIPHGAACGIMLPHAIRFNVGEGPAMDRTAIRYAEVASIFGVEAEGITMADLAKEAAEVVDKLLIRFSVPTKLGDWGASEEDLDVMARNAMLDHCHGRNPRPCTEADMRALYEAAR
ncbi:MAG: iron-containing alcohol dehydrogenase family protein [Candidatus Thorarchaeota archaeon]